MRKRVIDFPIDTLIVFVYDYYTLQKLNEVYGVFPVTAIQGRLKYPAYFSFRERQLNGFQGMSLSIRSETNLRKQAKDIYKDIQEITPDVFLNPEKYPEYFLWL